MQYCRKCNQELGDSDKFCRQCGTPVNLQDNETTEKYGQAQSIENKENIDEQYIDKSVEIVPQMQELTEELPNIQMEEQYTFVEHNNSSYSSSSQANMNTSVQPMQMTNDTAEQSKHNSKKFGKKQWALVGVLVLVVITLICCIPLFSNDRSKTKELFVYIKNQDIKVCSADGKEKKVVMKNYTDQIFDEGFNAHDTNRDDTIKAYFQATSTFDGTNLYFLRKINCSSDEDYSAELMYYNVRSSKKAKKIDDITWLGDPFFSKNILSVNDYLNDVQPFIYSEDNTLYYQKDNSFISVRSGNKEKLLEDIASFTRIDDTNIMITKIDRAVGVYKEGDKQLNIIYNSDRADAKIQFINSDCTVIYYTYNDILYRYKDNKVSEVSLQAPFVDCAGIDFMEDGSFYYLVEENKSIDLKQYIVDTHLEQDRKAKEPKEEDFINKETDEDSYRNIIAYYKNLEQKYNNYLDNEDDYYTDYESLEDFILSEETYTYYYDYLYGMDSEGTFEDYVKAHCTIEETDYEGWNKAQNEYYPISERNEIRQNINEYISNFQYTTYILYYVDDQGEKKVTEDINNFTICASSNIINDMPDKMHSIAYYKLPLKLETNLDIEDIAQNYYGALDQAEYDIYKKLCLNGQIYVAINGIEKDLELGVGNNYVMDLNKQANTLYIRRTNSLELSIPYQNTRETYYTYYDQLEQNTSSLDSNTIYKIDLYNNPMTPVKIGDNIDSWYRGQDGRCYYFRQIGEERYNLYADDKIVQKNLEYGIIDKITMAHGQEVLVLSKQHSSTYTIYIRKNGNVIDKINDVMSFYVTHSDQLYYITTDNELYSWKKDNVKKLDKDVIGACISEDMNYTELLYEQYSE